MITGKSSNISLRKRDLLDQKSQQFASKKIVFATKATVGDTGINLATMTVPTEMSSVGFVQPSQATLAAANLLFYKNNLTLISSARGVLIQGVSYFVNSSTQITFNGFTALANEIFIGVIDNATTTGLKVVDAQPVVISGTLPANTSDFNIGSPLPYSKYPSQQMGACWVFVDGQQFFRTVGNTSIGEGDYYELPLGDGNFQVIRFTSVDPINDRPVLVVSAGLLAERPDGSMMAVIENQQGKIDLLISVLADVAGVPTTYFQTAPSQADLKAFGDRVLALEGLKTKVTSAYTARKYERVIADTTAGAFNVTLPASPAIGDWVKIVDAERTFGTYAVTLLGNGANIEGSASSFPLDVGTCEVVYVSASAGWRVY